MGDKQELQKIFRQEAVDAIARDEFAPIITRLGLVGLHAWLLSSAVVLLLALVLIFVRYGDQQELKGYIYEAGIGQVVEADRAGTLTNLNFPSDGIVSKGEILLETQNQVGTPTHTDVGKIQIQYAKELIESNRRQYSVIRARLGLADSRYESYERKTEARINQLLALKKLLLVRLEMYERSLASATTLYSEKFSATTEVISWREKVLLMREELIEVENSLDSLGLEAELEHYEYELQQNQLLERLEILNAELVVQKDSVAKRELDKSRAYVAPISGKVSGYGRKVGESVRAGDRLFYVSTPNEEFRIYVRVEARALRLVAIGAEVNIKVDAYPFRDFGFLLGTVESLSYGSASDPADGAEASYHVASVRVIGWSLKDRFEEAKELTPGMSVIVIVSGPQIPIWKRLFNPIINYATN